MQPGAADSLTGAGGGTMPSPLPSRPYQFMTLRPCPKPLLRLYRDTFQPCCAPDAALACRVGEEGAKGWAEWYRAQNAALWVQPAGQPGADPQAALQAAEEAAEEARGGWSGWSEVLPLPADAAKEQPGPAGQQGKGGKGDGGSDDDEDDEDGSAGEDEEASVPQQDQVSMPQHATLPGHPCMHACSALHHSVAAGTLR